jgi:heme exporter protein B
MKLQTPFWTVALSVFRKDLRMELRSREQVSAMGLFALIAVLVYSFALELTSPLLAINEQLRSINTLLEELGEAQIQAVDPLNITNIVVGVFWVTVIFAVILGLNRSLATEREQGNMDAMLIAPIHRSAIFVGKTLANFVFAFIIGVILLPVITILFNISLIDLRVIVVLLLGVLGISGIGTLLAAMAVQTRSRETLLPIIMLPALLPVVLSVVRATNGIVSGKPDDLWLSWLSFVVFIDLLYLMLSYFAFPFVVED